MEVRNFVDQVTLQFIGTLGLHDVARPMWLYSRYGDCGFHSERPSRVGLRLGRAGRGNPDAMSIVALCRMSRVTLRTR